MDDAIVISDLEVKASVGVHDWERQIPQSLRIDMTLHVDLRPAGESDSLSDTVDYQALAGLAAQVAEEKHHALIEHFAERLAERLALSSPAIRQVDLTVHKPGAIARARTISVRIHRGREDYPR